MISYSFEEMKELLEPRLKPSRFRHSLGVAGTAVQLARRFAIDEEKARIAGLLHDCAREYKNDAMREEADKRHIPYGPVEASMPLLLHGYIGALRVKELYGVDDDEISQAIYRHTVGGPQMTRLDKIIWFSDMIEPNRDYPGVERLRNLAENRSLDEMVLAGFTASIRFVAAKGNLIHPMTVQARNELIFQGVKLV